ncbi:prohibitin family protein [Allostreptomyces psammosilenae]|uniref:Regulator of protease activity HflC (Stomatin/prohibitin superfamily) n=1 Tax=Allostreptomyces psammosilenae TaxID=1892865 RepID=A0A852ZZR5_9ACTN|nr:prohibitin family protein [Allostreptomyces psammosilenae]NYI03618.1 regulator of protease activity HflC (stomatin/prohibitin superfamily) [Allostreptomyces psammosilenae]
MFVLALLLIVVGIVITVAARRASWPGSAVAGGLAALLSGLFFGVLSLTHTVQANEVGVPVTFGRVGDPLQPGLHLVSPFTDITSYSTRPVNLDLVGEETVEVRSSQGGVLYADVTVKWSVMPEEATELYRQAGTEEAVQERLVLPDSREVVRNVFARYTSEEGYATRREELGPEIAEALRERLTERGITVDTVNLRNVRPSDQLQEQIDLTIQQREQTQRAEEAVRTAEAEAERMRVEAEAEAEANRLLSESLTDEILLNRCIEAFSEAAAQGAVYAVPCGNGAGTPVIVDGTAPRQEE